MSLRFRPAGRSREGPLRWPGRTGSLQTTLRPSFDLLALAKAAEIGRYFRAIPMLAQRYMTGRDACQVGRNVKESEVDAASRAGVDRDADARDERGASRYEKADKIGDVFRRRDALERVLALDFSSLRFDRLASCCSLLLDQR